MARVDRGHVFHFCAGCLQAKRGDHRRSCNAECAHALTASAKRFPRGGGWCANTHSYDTREALRERWQRKGEQLRALDAKPEKPHGLKGRRPANLDTPDAIATRRLERSNVTVSNIGPGVHPCRHEGDSLE